MNRFIKTLGLLIISLFLLASGIDATLERMASSSSARPSIVTMPLADPGEQLVFFTGDLEQFAELGTPKGAPMPAFLRRVRAPGLVPMAPESGYRWL